MKTYKIQITAGCFGTREDFYKEFMKGNRIVELEDVEYEGDKEQHNTGILTDILTVAEGGSLVEVVKNYIDENEGFDVEYFSVRDTEDADETVVLTEEDI